MPDAAHFRDVTKRYATSWRPTHLGGSAPLVALGGVTLAVPTGSAFGLLGPNRAGKTTLIKLLLNLARPSSGAVERLGRPAADRSTLARVGYMHENHAFPRYLSATQVLELCGGLDAIPGDVIAKRGKLLLEQVGLSDRAAEPISRFSKGMVQRLGIAQALLGEPELLVLDEPAEGLDLLAREFLSGLIRDFKARGRTVVLVSHNAEEVEAVCDAVAVVVGGQLRYSGSASTLAAGRPMAEALAELYRQKAGVAA